MIGIRADINETIAAGHIMRCIAIAQQLEKLQEKVVFITADDYAKELLKKRGYDHIVLNSDWKDKDGETQKLIACIQDNKIDKLIIDSYEVTQTYLKHLKPYTKVIYIDDLYKFEYPVDVLINYSLNVDIDKYSNLSKDVLTLLGNNYVPLRAEFDSSTIEIKKEVSNVLLTTGGSDNYCIIEKIIRRISEVEVFRNVQFHVIVGAFFQNTKELIDLSQKAQNINLHQHVTNMAEIMKECDIAISAGGTTLAELASFGIPVISFAMADNQLEGVNAFSEKARMLTVGDIRENIEDALNQIVIYLEELIRDKSLRMQISQDEKECIDGRGAERIANALKYLI